MNNITKASALVTSKQQQNLSSTTKIQKNAKANQPDLTTKTQKDFSNDLLKNKNDNNKLSNKKDKSNAIDSSRKEIHQKIEEDKKVSELYIKAKRGDDLTEEEISFLGKENPAIMALAEQITRQTDEYRNSLKEGTSTEDIISAKFNSDSKFVDIIHKFESQNMTTSDYELQGVFFNWRT